MKKLLALLLALAMLLCLAACGEDTKDDDSADKESESVTDKSEDDSDKDDEETSDTTADEETEETESETEESESEEETEPSTQNGVLSGLIGNVEGNGYENAFLGIGCELDSDWYIYNDSELASLTGITADMLTDEYLSDLIENSGTAFLFYAMKDAGLNTVNITLENTSAYGASLTEQTYLDAAIPMLEPALASAGFENIVITTGTTQFAGTEHLCIMIEGDMYGMKIYETLIPLIYENCVAAVTVCTYNTNTCADILAEFYAVAY